MNARLGFTALLLLLGVFHAEVAHAQTTGARAPSAPASATQTAHNSAVSAEGQVNINVASDEELQRLPGIGPARAAAVLALRQRLQRFRSAEDLLRVRGIGRASLRHLRPYVTLTGETTLLARPGRTPVEPSSSP